MSVVMAVVRDILTYFNPRTKRGRIHFVLLLILVLIGIRMSIGAFSEDTETPEELTPTVMVGTISDFTSASDFKLIGTVKATDQARIQSETSGRVVSVNVTLGQAVNAGAVIAQLENASQRAALLQAEGVYEAALAAAETSDISAESAETALTSAQNNARTALQNAYTTVSSVVYNSLDNAYTYPDQSLPGVRIDGGTYTPYLNATRVQLQTSLPAWQSAITSLQNDSTELSDAFSMALSNTNAVLTLTDTLINQLTIKSEDYAGTEFAVLRTTLLNERTTLTATLAALENAQSNLEQAEDTLRQAQLGGTNSTVSAANANVKQALGSLRAAEANYAKTVIRTPIAGVVNTLEVDAGDFVSVQSPIATVANNNALEITTFVGERDRARITIGQDVLVDGSEPGIISTIAPAINPATGKIEVKIQTESELLANGDTVNLTINTEASEDVTETEQPLLVPLTAVKFTASDGFMFTVENQRLVSRPVELGAINGSFVEIISGIDTNTEFVLDARGLTEDLVVEAVRE